MIIRANNIFKVAKKEYEELESLLKNDSHDELIERAAREKLDFRKEVLSEIPYSIFSEKEHDIIIKRNDFLNICWQIHLKYRTDVIYSIKIAVYCLVNQTRINN